MTRLSSPAPGQGKGAAGAWLARARPVFAAVLGAGTGGGCQIGSAGRRLAPPTIAGEMRRLARLAEARVYGVRGEGTARPSWKGGMSTPTGISATPGGERGMVRAARMRFAGAVYSVFFLVGRRRG